MSMDRAELAGTGAAIAFHVALIAALSLSLAHVSRPPEPPSMEVELVDQVGLKAAAPAPAAPPPASQAPEQAPPEATPTPPQPAPTPGPAPMAPPPTPAPTPQPRPAPQAAPAPRPAPPRPAPPQARPVPQPARPRIGADFLKGIAGPSRPAQASRIGADFLKGVGDSQSAKASAPAISASAMAGIQAAIIRQVKPCADRQINPGPGASKIKVRLHLVLSRSGALSRSPEVVGTTGVDEDNGKYEERVKDLAVATFTGCAPLTGLPQDLYKTSNGQGWGDFYMKYNLP